MIHEINSLETSLFDTSAKGLNVVSITPPYNRALVFGILTGTQILNTSDNEHTGTNIQTVYYPNHSRE